jgi:hypothetical protein
MKTCSENLFRKPVPICSNKTLQMNPLMVTRASRIRCLPMGELGPEKAGVGGSIPSLATHCIRHFSKSR